MKYVAFKPFLHLEYVRRVTKVDIGVSTRGIVAIDDNDKPQGVVLFDSWTSTSVNAHISIQNPMVLRGLHIEAFKYVFETCNKLMILGIVASDNAAARRLNRHFGFTQVARIPNAVDACVDQLVLQLLRQDCKYINQFKEVA